jgi:hypothetical protein
MLESNRYGNPTPTDPSSQRRGLQFLVKPHLADFADIGLQPNGLKMRTQLQRENIGAEAKQPGEKLGLGEESVEIESAVTVVVAQEQVPGGKGDIPVLGSKSHKRFGLPENKVAVAV